MKTKEIIDINERRYKTNRVRNLNEAFEEYPVDEEWHKGKVKNILRDSN